MFDGLLFPCPRWRLGFLLRGGKRKEPCLSAASLAPSPPRDTNPRRGSPSRARLSFAYFSLARQRKVSQPRQGMKQGMNQQPQSIPHPTSPGNQNRPKIIHISPRRPSHNQIPQRIKEPIPVVVVEQLLRLQPKRFSTRQTIRRQDRTSVVFRPIDAICIASNRMHTRQTIQRHAQRQQELGIAPAAAATAAPSACSAVPRAISPPRVSSPLTFIRSVPPPPGTFVHLRVTSSASASTSRWQ